ncbi:MAG: hypothetical protein IJT54_05150 [Candidatus Methanomethylophilaceae archaeon]|nr:hypothetical protein [Candidatus Methanomethylophilaceae archaeon]
MKVRGLLIDPFKPFCDFIEVEDKLDTYYEMLSCDLIEIHEFKVGDKLYTFVCDEEAAIRPIEKRATYVGNMATLLNAIFVCKCSNGNLKSLSKFDERYLNDHIRRYGSGAILMDMEP